MRCSEPGLTGSTVTASSLAIATEQRAQAANGDIDQFYEPFRGYDAPIVAIPGNHDGAARYGVDPNTPLAPTRARA